MRSGSDTGPRVGWIILAVLLSVLAVVAELTMHLCAAVFFDPLPNLASLIAYLALPVAILWNRHTLAAAERGPISDRKLRWKLGAAIAGSAAGLMIAATYTLLFLPVMPVGAIAVILYGLGLCAYSPAINFAVLAFQLSPLLRRWRESAGPAWRLIPACVLAATVPFFVLVGQPMAVGYLYERALAVKPREPSLRWLRWLRGEDTVLDLCYRRKTPIWVSLGRGLLGQRESSGWGLRGTFAEPQNDLSDARRIYFLLTGRPYESANARPPSFRGAAWDDWEPVTNEQGGELVGHAVRGLRLESSRIDGVLDPATETGYCEWTMVFENDTAEPAEARAELLLPEGGVVDKVSLWINGVERQAAFGARDVVRAAYQEVAVAQRRDPLLVTARRPDRVMAQCFPVPAHGTMQIRIGMSAPLVWEYHSGPVLCFGTPGFQQVNFRMPDELRHEVWLEGKWTGAGGKLAGEGWSLSTSGASEKRVHTARRQLKPQEILRPPVLHLVGGRSPQVGDRPAQELRRAGSPFAPVGGPVDLALVLDTSRGMEGAMTAEAWREVERAAKELPSGSQLRLVDGRQLAGDRVPASTAWTAAGDLSSIEGWWKGRQFAGGTEPAPALKWAVEDALTARNPAAVVWLHGAVPADLVDSTALAQVYDRRPHGPALVGVQLRPGPDALVDDLASNRRVFSVADRAGEETITEAIRLAAAAAPIGSATDARPLGGREPAINGTHVVDAGERNHAASRLATQSTVLSGWYGGLSSNKAAAPLQKLAIRRRLVTPLTGAVVLETKEQYARYELSDAAEDGSIPSVPEPGTLALLAVAGAMGAAHRLRRSRIRRQDAATG